jgi:oligopeptide transport system substrate-binding protein
MAPVLSRKRDLCTTPAFGTNFPCFNMRVAPFDNVLVRYAFNMAVNKHAFTRVLGFGRQPAQSLVPPLPGYSPPANVLVRVNGATYNVLEYNPNAARELLAAAGFPDGRDFRGKRLTFDLLYPNFQETRLKAEILQNEWQNRLSVRVNINIQEFKTFLQNQYSLNYTGVTDSADWGYYRDPTWFLNEFTTGASANVAAWSDLEYDSMLAKATATLEPGLRMQRLAECERYLLRAMPFMPLYHDVWAYPQKPYVRGITPNAMDAHPFKYAWIETYNPNVSKRLAGLACSPVPAQRADLVAAPTRCQPHSSPAVSAAGKWVNSVPGSPAVSAAGKLVAFCSATKLFVYRRFNSNTSKWNRSGGNRP